MTSFFQFATSKIYNSFTVLSSLPSLSVPNAYAASSYELKSDGTGCTAIGGTWSSPVCNLNTELVLNSGDMLTIDSGVTLTFPNAGDGVNVLSGGTLSNYGTINIDSTGPFSGGSLDSEGGTISNHGTINNSGKLNNYGTLNNPGATIYNSGAINNGATINNSGTIIDQSGATYTGNTPSGNSIIVSTPGRVTGGGIIGTDTNFGFEVNSSSDNKVKGNIEYQDKSVKFELHSNSILFLSVDPTVTQATFMGFATGGDHDDDKKNAAPTLTFTVSVTDPDKTGNHDIFSITVIDSSNKIVYDNSGTVKGHIEIHKFAK